MANDNGGRSDDSLVFDDIQSDGPGLHALLIGISRYPHLTGGTAEAANTYGLGQLSSPARTTKEVADLLIRLGSSLTPRLKTCRVLSSPSDGEAPLPAPEGPGAQTRNRTLRDLPDATLERVARALNEWRLDASRDKRDATLFYFAGHGLQRTAGDSVLCLQDFLGGHVSLDRAINMNNIYNGMANPEFPELAQTQLFIVDACRGAVRDLKKLMKPETAQIFDVDPPDKDNRVAPILFAAGAGYSAYGKPGDVSLFGQDFIRCLSEGAGECVDKDGQASWVLTFGELFRVLGVLVARHNTVAGTQDRRVVIDKYTSSLPTTLRSLSEPPKVECLFAVDPPEQVEVPVLSLRTLDNEDVYKFDRPPRPHPHPCRIKMGNYIAAAAVDPPDALRIIGAAPSIVEVRPPYFEHVFRLRAK